MGLGTLGQVARKLRTTRAVVRAAVDAGLIRPVRIRDAGGGSYARLFDIAEAAARRDEIAAACESGELVPRGPRTRRREATGTSTEPSPRERPPSSGYIDLLPLGCSPAPADLMARLNELDDLR
jgi:hypothetical protein